MAGACIFVGSTLEVDLGSATLFWLFFSAVYVQPMSSCSRGTIVIHALTVPSPPQTCFVSHLTFAFSPRYIYHARLHSFWAPALASDGLSLAPPSALVPSIYSSVLSSASLFLSVSPSAGHPADIKVTVWSEITCAECTEQAYNGAVPVVACASDEEGAVTPSPSSAGVGVGVGDDDDAAAGGEGGSVGDDDGSGAVAAPTAQPTAPPTAAATAVVDGELGLCCCVC